MKTFRVESFGTSLPNASSGRQPVQTSKPDSPEIRSGPLSSRPAVETKLTTEDSRPVSQTNASHESQPAMASADESARETGKLSNSKVALVRSAFSNSTAVKATSTSTAGIITFAGKLITTESERGFSEVNAGPGEEPEPPNPKSADQRANARDASSLKPIYTAKTATPAQESSVRQTGGGQPAVAKNLFLKNQFQNPVDTRSAKFWNSATPDPAGEVRADFPAENPPSGVNQPARKRSVRFRGSQPVSKSLLPAGKLEASKTTGSSLRSESTKFRNVIQSEADDGKPDKQQPQSQPEKSQRYSSPQAGDNRQNNEIPSSDQPQMQPQAVGSKVYNGGAGAGPGTAGIPTNAIPRGTPLLPRMIQRILSRLNLQIQHQTGVRQIRVNLGSWGRLNIQLTRDVQTRKVTIWVETESTKEAVQSSLNLIQANLNRKGINISAIDVRLPQENVLEQQQSPAGNQNFRENFGAHTDSDRRRGTGASRGSGSRSTPAVRNNSRSNQSSRDFGYNTMEVVA